MILPDEQPNFDRSPRALITEYARMWWTIQREFPGITLRAVLAAIRAHRYGSWQSLDQIVSGN